MIQLKTILDVADNTGARKASVISVLNAKGKMWAKVGDIVRVNVKESTRMLLLKKAQWQKVLLYVPKKLFVVQMAHMYVLIAMRLLLSMMLEIQKALVYLVLWRVSCATWNI